MKCGKRGLEEEHVTDLEERATNEKRQRRFVPLPSQPIEYSHFSIGDSYRLIR